MERSDAQRQPATPEAPLDLDAAADELLEEARSRGPGRMARNLTPGEGASLSQTLVAMRSGAELAEHVTNGPATIQVLRGAVTLSSREGDLGLQHGQWATIPRDEHRLSAQDDSVLLLTVAPVPGH